MIFYTSSMDQYGPAVGSVTDGGNGGQSRFNFDNEILLGDGWTNMPEYGNPTVQWSPSGTYDIEAPSWGARRGDYALVANQACNVKTLGAGFAGTLTRTALHGFRFAIPGATSTVRYMHFAFGIDSLPVESGHGFICDFCDAATAAVRASLRVNSSGRLEIVDGVAHSAVSTASVYATAPTVLATTSSPVISADTWYSINIRIETNATDETANVDIYVGDIIPANLVMSVTGLAFTDTDGAQPAGAANNIDVLSFLPASLCNLQLDQNQRAIRDIVLYDTTGTYNNTYLGQVFVAAQQMRNEDNEGSNWQSFPRENIGTGIGDFRTREGAYVADNAALELGSGDYTIEGWFKLDDINVSPDETVLLSKWDEGNSARSWKLEYDDTDGRFKFIISTDGVAETVVLTYPFVPEKQKYYHVAVTRATSVTRVFINGEQIGMDQTDANTYFDGSAALGIMGRFEGTTIDADTAADGWADEIRITVGVARYTSNFTPSTVPFGRNGVDDTNFASVEFLLGCDGSFTDESSNAFTVVAGTGSVTQEPDDDGNSYEVLNQRPAWDDSFIEAQNTFATGILELSANPADGETVTLGSKTYTFKTTLTPTANEVLIGADAAESIDHLVKAINAGTGAGTEYASGTTVNTDAAATVLPDTQMLAEAVNIGTAGNSVTSTETLASGSWLQGATLAGGVDIPSPSDFQMERLPVDVTGVLALQVTARGYKSDAGSANLRFDLKGPSAAVGTGSAQGTDLNPSWLRQIFEEDPDTVATITPSTITGGRVRVTRTT